MLMQKGIYKYRTDTRRYKRELHKEEAKLLDYKMHLVIRFVLFLKYLITFRMQDAKDALDMDKELSKEEEAYTLSTPYLLPKPRTTVKYATSLGACLLHVPAM